MSDMCLTCGGMIFTAQDGAVGYAGPICMCAPPPRIQRPASQGTALGRYGLQHTCKEIAEQITRLERECEVYREALEFYAEGSLGSDLEVRPDKKELWSIPSQWAQRSMSDYWSGKQAREALEAGEKIRGEK